MINIKLKTCRRYYKIEQLGQELIKTSSDISIYNKRKKVTKTTNWLWVNAEMWVNVG